MLIPAVIAIVALILPIGYVLFHTFSVNRQQIEFVTPQNGVSAICLDIQEDTVRSLYVLFEDGTRSELKGVRARPRAIRGLRQKKAKRSARANFCGGRP